MGFARWRRVAALVSLAVLVGGFMAVGIPADEAGASANGALIDRNLSSYVLLAMDHLEFKGGNESTHTRGWVLGGDVGVNNPDPKIGDTGSNMNVGANGLFKMSDGTQLVAGSMVLGVEASVYDVFVDPAGEAGTGWGATNPDIGGPTIRNTKYAIENMVDLPIIDPALLTTTAVCGPFAPMGTTDIIVPKNGSRTLVPGTYRDIQVQNGATLVLQAGTYTVRRFNTGQNVNVYTVPGTAIHIWGDGDPNATDFNLGGNGSYFGAAPGQPEAVACICVWDGIANNRVQFSDNGTFYGSIHAPGASLGLGRAFTHYGRFVAREIGSDFNVNITYRQCGAPARLTVVKHTEPARGSGFGFTTTGLEPVTFSLDDGGSRLFSNLAAATYTVAEDSPLPTGWQFTSAVCVNDDTAAPVGTVTGQLAEVTLAAGQAVTCTFTNTYVDPNAPGIDVEKLVSVDGKPCDDPSKVWSDADAAPGPTADPSVPLWFKFVVTNTGSTALTGVTLTDSVFSAASLPPFIPVVTDPLDSGAVYEYCYGPIALTALSNPDPLAGPSRNINTYALFAYDELWWKGGHLLESGDTGHIYGGNIGVNYPVAQAPSNSSGYSLTFGTHGRGIMSPGSQVVADSVRADDTEDIIYWLFANSTNPSFGATVLNPNPATPDGNWPFTTPIIATADLPTLPFTPHRALTETAADLKVGGSGGLPSPYTMLPGAYRDVRFNDDTVVYFGAGTYDMRSLSIGKKVTVHVTDDTILQIDETWSMNDDLTFGLGTNAGCRIYLGAYGLNPSTTRVSTFAHNVEIHARVFAPTGWVDLGGGTEFWGHVWAQRISGDPNNNIHFVGLPHEDVAHVSVVVGGATLVDDDAAHLVWASS